MTARTMTLAATLVVAAGCGTVVLPVGKTEPAEAPDSAAIESTVFLIGDAGNPAPDEPVLKALKDQVTAVRGDRVIVFLGDNIYPRGLPVSGAPDRSEADRRLLAQMQVGIDTRVPTYFVAGNHDWAYMGPAGWESIKRQTAFIDARGDSVVRMLPKNGCPGPEVVDVGRRVRVILLDTQWWVHEYTKPSDSTSGCATFTEQRVLDSLKSAIASAATEDSAKKALPEQKDTLPAATVDSLKEAQDTLVNRYVIVAGHHPIESGGQHGGYFGWQRHLFPLRRLASWLWIPLPGIGSIEPTARREGGTNQDLAGPKYAHMIDRLDEVFSEEEPLLYVAGHDHDMQVLKGSHVKTVLVSGAGIYGHVSPVDYRPNTRFAAAASGFMRLDFLRNGKVRLGVITVNVMGETAEAFSMYLE